MISKAPTIPLYAGPRKVAQIEHMTRGISVAEVTLHRTSEHYSIDGIGLAARLEALFHRSKQDAFLCHLIYIRRIRLWLGLTPKHSVDLVTLRLKVQVKRGDATCLRLVD